MQLVYEGNWSTYEEWGSIRIYENSYGDFLVHQGGRSVYSDPDDQDWDDPYPASYVEVLDLIDEWDEIEKEYENYFDGEN
jgi:hypothetical protein